MANKSLKINSIFNSIYTLLNLLFPLITSVYVSRVLLPEGVGRLSYVQSIVSYFTTLAILGLPNYGLREIARVRENQKEKNKLFSELIVINSISTFISLLVYVFLVFTVNDFRQQWPLFMSCGFMIFLNLFNIDWFYQGQEDYVYIVFRSLVVKILSIFAMFAFVKTQNDLVTYAWITSFATGGNYIFNAIHAKRYVKLSFNNLEIKKHLKPIFIMAAGIILASIYNKVDITMLGIMTSDTHTGYYTYGHKIIDLVLSITTAITAVFMPRLSFFYKNDRKEFNSLINRGVELLTFLSFPMAVGVFVVSPQIIEIMFGPYFFHTVNVVRVFCILIIVKSFGNLLCFQVMMCTDNEKERLPSSFLGSLVNVGLNFLLIPLLFEIGAAIASVISELIINGYQLIKLKKYICFRIKKKIFLDGLLSTFAMLLVCLVLNNLKVNVYMSLIIVVFGGTTTYFLINFVLKNEIMMYGIETIKGKFRKNNI